MTDYVAVDAGRLEDIKSGLRSLRIFGDNLGSVIARTLIDPTPDDPRLSRTGAVKLIAEIKATSDHLIATLDGLREFPEPDPDIGG